MQILQTVSWYLVADLSTGPSAPDTRGQSRSGGCPRHTESRSTAPDSHPRRQGSPSHRHTPAKWQIIALCLKQVYAYKLKLDILMYSFQAKTTIFLLYIFVYILEPTILFLWFSGQCCAVSAVLYDLTKRESLQREKIRERPLQSLQSCRRQAVLKQALRKFSATAKGWYWQTYEIVSCWTAYFTLVNMNCQLINYDSVSQPFFLVYWCTV